MNTEQFLTRFVLRQGTKYRKSSTSYFSSRAALDYNDMYAYFNDDYDYIDVHTPTCIIRNNKTNHFWLDAETTKGNGFGNYTNAFTIKRQLFEICKQHKINATFSIIPFQLMSLISTAHTQLFRSSYASWKLELANFKLMPGCVSQDFTAEVIDIESKGLFGYKYEYINGKDSVFTLVPITMNDIAVCKYRDTENVKYSELALVRNKSHLLRDFELDYISNKLVRDALRELGVINHEPIHLKTYHRLAGHALVYSRTLDGKTKKECWLMGVDEGSYFASHLPKFKTYGEAYDVIKPQIVKDYEANGVEVTRQGEWYFVSTGQTYKQFLKDMNIKIKDANTVFKPSALPHHPDGHKHWCKIYTHKKEMFVYGSVKHPEHRTVKLGDIVHRVFKNTSKADYSIGIRNVD